MVEEIKEAAERGRPSRPRKSMSERAVALSVSVPASLLQRLENEAEGRPFSRTVRDLLADALDRLDRRREREARA
jgi:hypothetical protein